MFEHVQTAPPDPILGLTETFNADTRSEKINLSVGVYKDAAGKTPILATVKEAERRLLENETSKGYKPISGDPVYDALVQKLLFGAGSDVIASKRAFTAHTPGGTGGLRVAGDYLHHLHSDSGIWVSDPTWANHRGIFGAAGLGIMSYPYYNPAEHAIDFDAMLNALKEVPAGDIVLLHGCCHNPTGQDPTVEQWGQIGQVLAEQGALPLVDFAYQGFAEDIDGDAAGLRELMKHVDELIICSSFSKNFGLYCERTGAITFVARDAAQCTAVGSQVKVAIRRNYSNPPSHGGAIVATILGDDQLRKQWEGEVAVMRDRINGMRQLFVDTLKAKGVDQDFSFITEQRGMFSFSGLSKEQVDELRDKHAIYIVGSGRINVAGMTESNMDRLCTAIAAVL
ncbi:MAG: aminotransferase class I/II-fold pyridoxal phosphate-dependent enzyme [Phycisphaera sp.]|nr:aminotransferase class I/II-fold pyridoxal phosphate-dependent enzyme [Phycisphaera sp.]